MSLVHNYACFSEFVKSKTSVIFNATAIEDRVVSEHIYSDCRPTESGLSLFYKMISSSRPSSSSTQVCAMATPRVIHLHPGELPEHSAPTLEPNAAQKASELLMENNKNYHIFFNTSGFHNHLVHHLLTVYALGASPETIAKQFEVNKEYQREMAPVDTSVVVQLHYKEKWKQCVGNEKYYNDFLTFFKAEMEWKGWEQVIKEYLLARDERANDLLVRMYNGKCRLRLESLSMRYLEGS